MTTDKPRRRGRPKGFIQGSFNDHMSRTIPEVLAEYGPLTNDDLHLLLRAPRAWLRRPLDRLVEDGVVGMHPELHLGRGGQMRDVVVVYLTTPVPRRNFFEPEGRGCPGQPGEPDGGRVRKDLDRTKTPSKSRRSDD